MCDTVAHMEFRTHLRQAMDMKSETTKGLARKWRPSSVEPARRQLQKYLSGDVTPTEATRDELARALGVPPSMLPLSADSQSDLLADLMAAVRRIENLERTILEKVA